ncbi:hypothetical protein [Salininema proteolyticum]|uniref:Uncharacterized protein n=1 Tax=Salininema proteolyticum TaxID=1607685 RepID=A0ABV8U5T5_9ACTN
MSESDESAAYGGPPRTQTPPPGWRVPEVYEVRPPRRLPSQDMAAIDRDEERTMLVTRWFAGTALVASMVFLLVALFRSL